METQKFEGDEIKYMLERYVMPMVEKGADTIGTLTFGSDIAAGATAVYAPDATHGGDVLNKGDVLSFVTSAAADATYHLDVEFDPECIVPEP